MNVTNAEQQISGSERDLQKRQIEYSEKSRKLQLVEGWPWDATEFQPRPDQPVSPGSPAIPYIWRWSEVEHLVREMGNPDLGVGVRGGKAAKTDRRVLVCRNPGVGEQYAITQTIAATYQNVKKGESAPAHRHTTSTIRYVLAGAGGWSTVEGERAMESPRDIVINQPLSWHDHGNDGPDDSLFLNVMDVPLLTSLATACWDFDSSKATGDKNKYVQDVKWPLNYSNNLYQAGGIVPKFVGSSLRRSSPLVSYKWQAVRESLSRLQSEAGSPYDGVIVELTNPVCGDSVLPTMSICAQLLRPREETLSHRHNTNSVYIVAEGRGYTQIGEHRFDWSENDVFALPSWQWHHHGNSAADNDAVLYCISDSPVIEKLGLYCENRKLKDGRIEVLGWEAHRLIYYK